MTGWNRAGGGSVEGVMAPRLALLLLAAAFALGGCAAASDGTPAAPPSSSSSFAAPSSSVAVPSLTAVPPSAGAMTVSGDVAEGVEAGCLLLKTPGTLYLLLGGDRAALQVGKRVTVVGRPQPGMMTTCQQGTPFQVTSVRSG